VPVARGWPLSSRGNRRRLSLSLKPVPVPAVLPTPKPVCLREKAALARWPAEIRLSRHRHRHRTHDTGARAPPKHIATSRTIHSRVMIVCCELHTAAHRARASTATGRARLPLFPPSPSMAVHACRSCYTRDSSPPSTCAPRRLLVRDLTPPRPSGYLVW
jgi:hypothetical protein